MSVVERLRRTGQYAGNVASRSVGIWYYSGFGKEIKIRKEIGQPSISKVETGGVIFSLTLFPAANLSLPKEDKRSDSKIGAKFVAGVKVLSGLAIDISPLVAPIVVSIATKDSLPLLGIIGKPLLNAMVHATSDLMEARAFKRKNLPKAAPGTYDLLQEAYDESYDRDLKIGVIKDTQGGVKAVVRREGVCAESGGSCMVLYVPIIDGEKRSMGYAHVTENDVVADIGAFTNGQTDDNIRPNMEELIVNLQKPLNQE